MLRPRWRYFCIVYLMLGAVAAMVGAAIPNAQAATPAGYSASGIDVSVFQGSVNWSAVKATGVSFAYIRASEQSHIPDANYATNFANAKAQGLLVGAYHRARPDASSGSAQALYFLDHAQFANDGKTLPPVVDMEWPRAGWTSPTGKPLNDCYNMTPAQLVAWTRAFLSEVTARTGRLGVIYTSTSWWNKCTSSNTTFGQHPLWVARYSTSPLPLPAGWSNLTFWQYSGTGTLPGGSPVDQDVFRGDLATLRQLAAGVGYHVLTSDGDVHGYGVPSYGSDKGKYPMATTAVGIAADLGTRGYWIAKSDGGVSNFNAPWYGSLRGWLPAGQKVRGIAATSTGGYLVLTSNGGVHNYGTPWYGSDANRLPTGITAVAIAANPATGGYWILKSNGGVDPFNAPWFGSLKGQVPAGQKVTGIAANPNRGYLVLTSDGNVHNYGSPWYGSDTAKLPSGVTAAAIAADRATGGYWILKSDGGLDPFNAAWYGSLSGQLPAGQAVSGIAGA